MLKWEILALALGVASLLVGDLEVRLYILSLGGSGLLLAGCVLLAMKRQYLLRLSGWATFGMGFALVVTVLSSGLGTAALAYAAGIAGAIVMGAGYLFVRRATITKQAKQVAEG